MFCNNEQKRHCDQNYFGRFKLLASYFFNVSGSGKNTLSFNYSYIFFTVYLSISPLLLNSNVHKKLNIKS